MTNVQALDTLTIYSNISKTRLLIQINSLQKRQNRNGYIKEYIKEYNGYILRVFLLYHASIFLMGAKDNSI